MEIRAPLFRERESAQMVFFEYKPDGILMRLPKAQVPEGTEYLPFRTKFYQRRRVADFVRFLQGMIVSDPEGKVSPKAIWNKWVSRPAGTDIDINEEIDGMLFKDVQECFLDVFNTGDRRRGRLDGEVQRVWEGFRLATPEDELSWQPAPSATSNVPAVAAESLTQETARVDVKSAEIALEVPYDGPTRAKLRYRLDEVPIGITIYLDKEAVAATQRPTAYRVSFEPIYE